jgi:hypothetical protein
VDERRDLPRPVVADLDVAERVCAQLGLGSAERGEEAEHQEFPPGQIESGARGEVTEAELGEEPGERVTEPVGERREVVPDLVAVDRELDRSALVVAIGFADGA